ncbi:hypothetical protein ABIC22_001479 [Paenibacillus sp. PvP094]
MEKSVHWPLQVMLDAFFLFDEKEPQPNSGLYRRKLL